MTPQQRGIVRFSPPGTVGQAGWLRLHGRGLLRRQRATHQRADETNGLLRLAIFGSVPQFRIENFVITVRSVFFSPRSFRMAPDARPHRIAYRCLATHSDTRLCG